MKFITFNIIINAIMHVIYNLNIFSFRFQSIILVYEYSMIHDSKPKAKRPNWLSLMNNSLETLPFEVKFNKEKLNPAIVQILPLILKTLKKNIYLDKIVEDSSSSSPSYAKKESTEELSTKNDVPGTQNWMRSPSSRLYTIEYKTSPILYFRNPTKNIEYFTKIRKIRDYQRIMNYVDKMISDRVSIGTTIPMAKYIYGAYKIPNIEYTTPMTSVENHKTNNIINMQIKKTKTASTQTVEKNCQCPKIMSDLLSKFIVRLKALLPNLSSKRHNISTSCNHSQQRIQENGYNKETTSKDKTLPYTSTHALSTATPKITKEYSSYAPQINIEHSSYNSVNIFQSQDDTMHDISKLIKPYEQIEMTNGNDFTYETVATKQYFDEISNKSNIEELLSTPMVSTQITPLKVSETTVTNNDEKKSSSDPEVSEFPVFVETDYENYNETNLNIIDYFKMLDAHSLELLKRKIVPNRKKIEHYKIINNVNNIENSIANSSPTSIDDYNIDLINENVNNSDIVVEPSTSSATTDPTKNEYFAETKTHSSINTTIIDYITTENTLNNIKSDPTLRSDDITLEEEIERAPLDDSDTSIKNLENIIKKLNNTYMLNKNNEASEYEWELVKIEDDKYPNSMIPQSRSSYLEIQRGDWKNEEHNDYDNNINNYNLFD